MRPEFVMFKTIGDGGVTKEIPVNANLVCMIVPATISGMVEGPTGEKIGKPAAALDFGIKMIPVDCTVKEAIAKLEGKTEPDKDIEPLEPNILTEG